MAKILNWLRGPVNWPTRTDRFTLLSVIIVIAIALFNFWLVVWGGYSFDSGEIQ